MLPSSVPLFMVMERLLQDVFLKSSKEFLRAKFFRSFSSVRTSTCWENNCMAAFVFPSLSSLKSLSAVSLRPDVA